MAIVRIYDDDPVGALITTHIVPFATVMFKLLSTWLGFDLGPYILNACRTDTAFCCRLHTVPPSSMVATVCSLPLQSKEKMIKI